jgi:hypothetical protein
MKLKDCQNGDLVKWPHEEGCTMLFVRGCGMDEDLRVVVLKSAEQASKGNPYVDIFLQDVLIKDFGEDVHDCEVEWICRLPELMEEVLNEDG